MPKVMLFIDGTWLYYNTSKLSEAYGQQDFRIDFGKLPAVLAETLKKDLPAGEVDIVRTYLFGSYASNYDLRDDDAVQRRRDFFEMLKEEYHYEVEVYPINFMGRRLRKVDRDPGDSFEPQEKCVDIALASSLLYMAAVPGAYDIAVVVVGDQDFMPVLQYCRRLGKRVAIASIKGSCSPELSDPRDEARVKDFDIIWLDELLPKLELKYEWHQLQCESPIHKGKREVWTTYHPRKGRKFYCDLCRQEFLKQKQEAQREFVLAFEAEGEGALVSGGVGSSLAGLVTRKFAERGFGFIETGDSKNYFFHLTDLAPGLDFDEVQEGLRVDFEIKKLPSDDRAGAAHNVRRHEVPETARFEA